MDFWENAKCREYDPEMWFEKKNNEIKKKAVNICNLCEVKTQCLNYAILHKVPYGIWGGKSPSVRYKMRFSHERDKVTGDTKPIIVDPRKSVNTAGSPVWFERERFHAKKSRNKTS